jgi:hypothetical protein
MVKDYLGTLRSALDYLNSNIPNHGRYFPICATATEFNNQTAALHATTRAALEAHQPYNNNAWLKHLNILNNKSKHLLLVPQKRNEIIVTTVSRDNSGVQWTQGVSFGPGVSVMGVPIDPSTQLPVPNNVAQTKREIWVSFTFDESVSPELPAGIDALSLLETSLEKIEAVIADVEASLS